MKELIFISFLLVLIISFVVGYLTGKDAVKQKRRRTPHAPDGAICPRCNRSVRSAGHRYACILHGTPRR